MARHAAARARRRLIVLRAAERLGIAGPVVEPTETAGLLEVGMKVRFRRPLVRSAVYRTASPEERREVHRALAEATDPEVDPDRHAWHLAEATTGHDEYVASVLVKAATRAQARGGVAAAAAFLERSVGLTADPARQAERAVAAARAKHLAGAASFGAVARGQAGLREELPEPLPCHRQQTTRAPRDRATDTPLVEEVANAVLEQGHAAERVKTERFGPTGG